VGEANAMACEGGSDEVVTGSLAFDHFIGMINPENLKAFIQCSPDFSSFHVQE